LGGDEGGHPVVADEQNVNTFFARQLAGTLRFAFFPDEILYLAQRRAHPRR
jgi:hypothetical protein